MAPFPSATKTWHTSSYPSISPTNPHLSLTGKTVLITGGGAGIGFAISKSLAQANAQNLIILGRRSSVLSSASKEIQSLPNTKTKVFTISTDITNKESVDAAFVEIKRLLPGVKLDILVTNAGFFTGLRALGTETPEEWTTSFGVNVLGLYLVISAFIPLAKPDATIINISTAIAHLFPFPGFSSYGATKLAGAKLLDYVAAANPGLRVVNVHPGQVTETEMSGKAKGSELGDLNSHIDDAQLAGDFTVWVASEEAKFLKGKFVWVNWDVEELKERKEEIESGPLLTLGLEGFSSFK
jgi:NAD(P)-dependent dehydrogenase (short-subunit alcohol dehydrogenase family)